MIDDEKLEKAKAIIGSFSRENQLQILKRLLLEPSQQRPPAIIDFPAVNAYFNRTQRWKAQFGKLQAFLQANGFAASEVWWNGNGAEFEVTSEAGDIKLTLSNGFSSEKEQVEKIELFFRLQVPDKSST
jgi:hypothetical protein